MSNKKTASQLQIGDTFKKQGYTFTILKITQDKYKNGTPCIMVECGTNGKQVADSFFSFKLTTKI
jgi:hypothetical protein